MLRALVCLLLALLAGLALIPTFVQAAGQL